MEETKMEKDRRIITTFNKAIVAHCLNVARAEKRKDQNRPTTDRRKTK